MASKFEIASKIIITSISIISLMVNVFFGVVNYNLNNDKKQLHEKIEALEKQIEKQ